MLDRLSKILCLVMVTEICLGGGGRLIAVGPVSLRMALFLVALAFTGLQLISGKRIPVFYWKAILLFLVTIAIGCVAGKLNGSSSREIWEDVKPLLFFLMLPFFALAIERKEASSIAGIVKTSSIILLVLFVSVLTVIHSGLVPFLKFYHLTLPSAEFFYRGELTFFYKGFLFFGVGAIFFFFSDSRNKHLAIAMLVGGIVLSVTRGLLFSLALTATIYFLFGRKLNRAIIILIGAISIVIWGNYATVNVSRLIDSFRVKKSYESSNPNLLGNRKYSDDDRRAQVQEVLQRVSLSSALIGHGFGQGVPARPVHMEISYLEIFHKQGIIGLAFWSFVAISIFMRYRSAEPSLLMNAYFYSSLFVFVQSLTNQYINNPIGLCVLLLSLVCLDKEK